MKYLILTASLVAVLSCNSNKKDKPAATPAGDTAGVIHPPDTATTRPEPVTGKIDIESFGDLKIGQPADEAARLLGDPSSKAKAEKWEADGLMHQDWNWKDKGLVVNVTSDPANSSAPRVIASITASAPCNFKTKAGVSIGNTYEEVQAAYKDHINKEESGDDQMIIGNMYGGIVLTFRDKKVAHIFLGAAAE
ncbi:MAG: hypothetical protein U0U70_09925 [Chitinophagaceae bacterium]